MRADCGSSMKTNSRAIRANEARMKARDAHHRRLGYDSAASIRFVLSKVLPLCGHVLEVGTGKGRFLAEVARHAARVTTLDIDRATQREARLHVKHAGVADRVRFKLRDAGRTSLADASFDAVVSMNAMHHMEAPGRVVAEMLRLVKPSGKVIVADLNETALDIFDRVHRLEGKVHPRPKVAMPGLAGFFRKKGWRVRRFRGCHQDVLVADRSEQANDAR